MATKDALPAEVAKAFAAMPDGIADILRKARLDILRIASTAEGIGPLTETLKRGEPAYLTNAPKTGTTLRLGLIGGRAAVMVPCSTTILEDARAVFGELPEFSGKRGVILGGEQQVFDYIVNAALSYHMRKRR
ncbi:hypothetical protein BCF46_0560 [Litoreibacter meonggei]|uniref:Uncharacterized protein n=1 Tax=Litoreibacter meonggei TaxID=1049199 RepID=A0A497X574_9RHOB|nr:DUF1801 domain-containing protein [Litoreibacter meonggei]RLJ60362.1 hypothetical protein BCF46_0560 [Litoreibacter meonggei]